MKQILLVGAGGHCKSCIDVIEQIGGWQIAGIVDRKDSGVTQVLGYPIIGCDDDLAELRKQFDYAFVTIGQIRSAEVKIKLFNQLKSLGFKQPCLVSPLAYVSKLAQIGEGTIIMHHALINTMAKVGDNCIINSKALIEHDAIVEDHCHISTGATINGGVVVGEQSFIGSLATTKQSMTIPPQSFIKAGSLVK
jgi:sugar O-acyltransferase (sialic acid O-acetyltransferase NeuD family)